MQHKILCCKWTLLYQSRISQYWSIKNSYWQFDTAILWNQNWTQIQYILFRNPGYKCANPMHWYRGMQNKQGNAITGDRLQQYVYRDVMKRGRSQRNCPILTSTSVGMIRVFSCRNGQRFSSPSNHQGRNVNIRAIIVILIDKNQNKWHGFGGQKCSTISILYLCFT